MKVPIFKLSFDDDFIEKFQEGSKAILLSGMLTNGVNVRKFENNFSAFCDLRYALAVNSGTGAIEVVLRALNFKDKKVIVPTNTFVATAMAVENVGLEFDLVDIEDQALSICPVSLEQRLKIGDVGAVIVVHIGGIVSHNIEQIVDLCKKYNVFLIEDAAHAHGASFKGRKAGTFGVAGCFSFFPTKVMTTGEGGMVVTSDEILFEKMKSVRQFGLDFSQEYIHVDRGSNYKMTEFQALLGRLELDRLLERISRRKVLAKIYKSELAETRFDVVDASEPGENAFYKVIFKSIEPSGKIRDFCKVKGVQLTGEVYKTPLHRQPVYDGLFESADFPVAEKFCNFHICPPLYPELSEEEVRYVCQVLREFDEND